MLQCNPRLLELSQKPFPNLNFPYFRSECDRFSGNSLEDFLGNHRMEQVRIPSLTPSSLFLRPPPPPPPPLCVQNFWPTSIHHPNGVVRFVSPNHPAGNYNYNVVNYNTSVYRGGIAHQPNGRDNIAFVHGGGDGVQGMMIPCNALAGTMRDATLSQHNHHHPIQETPSFVDAYGGPMNGIGAFNLHQNNMPSFVDASGGPMNGMAPPRPSHNNNTNNTEMAPPPPPPHLVNHDHLGSSVVAEEAQPIQRWPPPPPTDNNHQYHHHHLTLPGTNNALLPNAAASSSDDQWEDYLNFEGVGIEDDPLWATLPN